MQNIKNIINHIQNNSITNLSGLSTGVELYLLSCCTDFFVYITSSENLEKARLQLEIFGKKPVVFPYFCSDNKYSFSIDSLLLKEQQSLLKRQKYLNSLDLQKLNYVLQLLNKYNQR